MRKILKMRKKNDGRNGKRSTKMKGENEKGRETNGRRERRKEMEMTEEEKNWMQPRSQAQFIIKFTVRSYGVHKPAQARKVSRP